MTQLEVLALTSAVLAVAGVVLFLLSIRPSVVVGPPWAAVLVVVILGGGVAATWFLAQATPAGRGWIPTAAVASLAVLTAFGGGPLAAAALRLTDPRPVIPASSHGDDPPDDGPGDPDDPPPPGPDDDQRASPATPDVLRGGELVGLLERACILALLLVGYPEGVVVTLAIKGLGRFGELKIPAAPERFIVGTLASVLWAVLGFAAIRAVLS